MKRLSSAGFDERDVEALYYVSDCDVLYRMPRLTSSVRFSLHLICMPWSPDRSRNVASCMSIHRPTHLAHRPSASSASVRSALSAGSSSFSQLRSWRSLHPSPASSMHTTHRRRQSTPSHCSHSSSKRTQTNHPHTPFSPCVHRRMGCGSYPSFPHAQPGTGPDFSLLERASVFLGGGRHSVARGHVDSMGRGLRASAPAIH
ncbi:hypothetical protein B0H14DRAFT_1412766 [Mycena olivaceomarginata]|nr:hypothetical protein B0H14DRAFT_1412766 [Mycena olivaceomarginata]